MRRPVLNDFSAHFFHHVPEMHTRRARGLARTAIETSEHMLDEGIRDLRPAFIKRAHEINAAARRIHLTAEHSISGARRETQAAMDAIQVQRRFFYVLVANFFHRRHDAPGSTGLPGRTHPSFFSSNHIRLHLTRRLELRAAIPDAPFRRPSDTSPESCVSHRQKKAAAARSHSSNLRRG